MNIVTREQWGARQPTRITPFNGPAREVFIHHGASAFPADIGDRDGDGVPDGEEALAREYQGFHMNTKGWSDIAYNFLVSQTGRVYEGRGWDRVGGGTGSPQDSYSMSICAMGNFEERPPTPELINAYTDLIVAGIKTGKLTADVVIRGDRDVNSTACPGKHLYGMIPVITEGVRRALREGEEEVIGLEKLRNGWREFNAGDEATIRFVQEVLRQEGFRPGAPDGKLRPMTIEALRQFGAGDDPSKLGPPAWRRLVAAAVEFEANCGAVEKELAEVKAIVNEAGSLLARVKK